MLKSDFLVIGSGISGLNFALNAAEKGRVLLITKKKLMDSNTNYAQGGIAAVLDKADNFEQHVADTMEAGNHHNKREAVEFMVKNAPAAIRRLIELGVQFESENGQLKLTREGGHSTSRIAYVSDYTGREIEHVLVTRVKENPNIKILEDCFAAELIIRDGKCYGCQVIQENQSTNLFAKATIIATGGIGQAYKYTTNPKIATGDGLAMAIRAGCKTKDLEFDQFHPTALDKDISPMFLISEAVRGEGAKLVDSDGNSIMEGVHPMGELAPRSIVAKTIYEKGQTTQVYLDIRHKKEEELQKRFPQIYSRLKALGINMSKELIPVTPAAHYLCGGIEVNFSGQTNIDRLYAFGEVSYTGVHGANRLASNSLLEALVFSNEIAKDLDSSEEIPTFDYPKIKISELTNPNNKLVQKYIEEIKSISWQGAGILRDSEKIKSHFLPLIEELIKKIEQINQINIEIYELQNMALVTRKILELASKRTKSLGCHQVNQ